MPDPKVSVVLLAHNGARFVGEAVSSILGQSYQNIELIVVDDGSTDDTPAILARFRDPRMRVIRQPNLWISFARNRGVSMATGQYVAAMSHDDVSLPDRLSTQIAAMLDRHLDVCFTWAEIIDGEGRPINHFLHDIFNQPGRSSEGILKKLRSGNFLLAPSVVCRRECYCHFASNVLLFGLQDYALWLQMLPRFRAGILETPLLKYRVHDSNVSMGRFQHDYLLLESLACHRLADDPPFLQSAAARRVLAHQWLEKGRKLVESPGDQVKAYLAANRAVNLDPVELGGYQLVADVLSNMGHAEPAELVRGIGERVDPALAYPLPLLNPR